MTGWRLSPPGSGRRPCSLSPTPAGVTRETILALEGHEDFFVRQVPSAVVPAMTSFAFGIYLRATPQRVCQALSDPALVPGWLADMSSGPAGEEDPRRLTCEGLLGGYLE